MNRTTTTRIAAAAGLLLSLGGLAACSSDDGDEGASGGDAIKIFSIAPVNTQANNFETGKVIEAYFKKVNAAGGINGKKVELVACNDKFDPNESANCARQAVREKAVALVGGFSGFEDQVFPVLEQGKLPWVGAVAASAKGLTSPYSYPLAAGPLGFAALGGAAAQCDKTTPVILDSPAAVSTLDFASGAMQKAGKKFEDPVRVAQTTVDFAPVAKSIQGSDCTLVTLPNQMYLPLLTAMQQLGTKTKVLSTAAILDQSVLAKWPADVDSFLVGQYPSVEDPAWAEAKAAVPPGVDMSLGVLQNSWIAAKVFHQVVEGISGEVTNASVKAAMDSTTAADTGGLSKPIDFTKKNPVPALARITNTNVVIFTVKDGKLVQQGDFVDVAPTGGQ
jgi:ABC-type branched-subunit amino acid transport system substrate-binding protein